jgi:hypothetical protein
VIPDTYHDVLTLVRRQIAQAGIDLRDQALYDAVVRHEKPVYGREDYVNTDAQAARLQRRTPTIYTALVAPWVGAPTISDPATTTPVPLLQDSRSTAIMPLTQDLQRGVWTFAEARTAVYIQGTYVDIIGAALDCLDLVLDSKVELVTTTDTMGTINLDQIAANVERLISRLQAKRPPMPVSTKG